MENEDFLQGNFDTEWVNRSEFGSAVVG